MDPIVAAAFASFGIAPASMRSGESGFEGDGGDSGGIVNQSMRATGFFDPSAADAGTALNPQDSQNLFVKWRRVSQWGRYVSIKPTEMDSGSLTTLDLEGFTLAPTGGSIPLRTMGHDVSTWTTRGLSGAFGLKLKTIRAMGRNRQDTQSLLEAAIANGVGNLLLDVGINGDTSLPSDGDVNKLRASQDGWFTRLRAAGRSVGDDNGSSYHNGMWAGLLDELSDTYRADAGMQWGYADKIGTKYLTSITSMGAGGNPAVINDFGATLLNKPGGVALPLGKPGLIIPQIGTTGYGAEGYGGMSPTSVTDNGDGTITININTLAAGVNRGASGPNGQRYVTVTCSLTGQSETLGVTYSSPNNTITTASRLGQAVGGVSTTASNYKVRWADLTTVAAGLWRHLFMVVQNGVRIYPIFHPRDETVEVVVHTDVAFPIVDPAAFYLADHIITPRNSIVAS